MCFGIRLRIFLYDPKMKIKKKFSDTNHSVLRFCFCLVLETGTSQHKFILIAYFIDKAIERSK